MLRARRASAKVGGFVDADAAFQLDRQRPQEVAAANGAFVRARRSARD